MLQTVFVGPAVPESLAAFRAAKGAEAGDLLTGALRGVLAPENGQVSAAAGDRAALAVTLLLTESAPTVLEGAPDSTGLRAYLEHLDTELTPARRTAAQGVLARLLVPGDNAWLAAHEEAGTVQAARADLATLAELLADAG